MHPALARLVEQVQVSETGTVSFPEDALVALITESESVSRAERRVLAEQCVAYSRYCIAQAGMGCAAKATGQLAVVSAVVSGTGSVRLLRAATEVAERAAQTSGAIDR